MLRGVGPLGGTHVRWHSDLGHSRHTGSSGTVTICLEIRQPNDSRRGRYNSASQADLDGNFDVPGPGHVSCQAC